MRRLCFVLFFAVGCAASTVAPDAGADMSVSRCDGKVLFSSCSQQCGFRVCFVGTASCEVGQWKCNCAQASPCNGDGGPHD